MIWLVLLVLLPALPMAAMAYTTLQLSRLPEDHPAALRARPDRASHCVVCVGDSITHGRVGADWVGPLRERMKPRGVDVANAGLNGDLAWNVLQRLPDTLGLNPAAVVVLIGTNDAMGGDRRDRAEGYKKSKKLPQIPDAAFFETQLHDVLSQLAASVEHVAVCTIPPLGEDADQDIAPATNRIVRRVAADLSVQVLDLHAALLPLLPPGGVPYDGRPSRVFWLVMKVCMARYLLGRSWDSIASAGQQVAFVDSIHLSDRAADVVQAVVAGWVESKV